MNINPEITKPMHTTGAIVGVGLVAWLLKYGEMPAITFILGWVTIVVAMFPLWHWIRRGERTVPMFPLISLSYGIFTGLGAISQPNTITILSKTYVLEWEYINKALLLSVTGIIALNVAFYASRGLFAKLGLALDLPIAPARRLPLILFLVGSALLSRFLFFKGLIPWGGHIQFTQGFLLLACVLVASFYYRTGTGSSTNRSVLIVLLSYLFLAGASTGMLETAIIPILTVVIVRIAWLRRIPVLLTVACFVMFVVVNSAKLDYRQRAWVNEEAKTSLDSYRIWIDVMTSFSPQAFLFGEPGLPGDLPWRKSLARFSVMDRLAWVCKSTPERIPHLRGESYRSFIFAPIPRIVWPGKPIMSEALTNIDAIYELSTIGAQGNLTAAVGIGYIGEGYANFGVVGVIVVTMLQGLVLSFIDTLCNRRSSEGGLAIYVGVCIYMLNGVASSAIIIYGTIFQVLICSALIIYPFTSTSLRAQVTPRNAR